MTREEFIQVLDQKGYSYEIEGDKLVVNHKGHAWLYTLEKLPPGVEFKNRGYVNLKSLVTLPPGVVFNNKGNVYVESLKSISPDVEFRNVGWIHLESLTGSSLNDWKGNIEGINEQRLLNLMISKGVFI